MSSKMFPTETKMCANERKCLQCGKKRDIITYKSDNAFITHRIIKMDGDSIIAKGDNNNTQDKPITKDAVLGKVVFIFNKKLFFS